MKYPIPNPSGNQMLSLINGLYQRSAGMCSAGAGPYGIGTSVVEMQLLSNPNPKTRILAETLQYFEGKTWTMSCAECQEAFEILADAEMREVFGLDEQDQAGPKLGM